MNRNQRRSIRLPGYNYSSSGEYFITICIQGRKCILGEVIEGKMVLNNFGHFVNNCWASLPQYYENLSLGEWIVMPNHIHGILIIDNPVGAIHELPLSGSEAIHEFPIQNEPSDELPLHLQRQKILLSKIIGRFKMNTGKFINQVRQTSGQPVWQRNYYEHIIRNEKSYDKIKYYIINNTLNWYEDRYKLQFMNCLVIYLGNS